MCCGKDHLTDPRLIGSYQPLIGTPRRFCGETSSRVTSDIPESTAGKEAAEEFSPFDRSVLARPLLL